MTLDIAAFEKSTALTRIHEDEQLPDMLIPTSSGRYIIRFRGRYETLSSIAKRAGIPASTIMNRMTRGRMSVEEALTTPHDRDRGGRPVTKKKSSSADKPQDVVISPEKLNQLVDDL